MVKLCLNLMTHKFVTSVWRLIRLVFRPSIICVLGARWYYPSPTSQVTSLINRTTQGTPESRGYLHISSSDPYVPPDFYSGFLAKYETPPSSCKISDMFFAGQATLPLSGGATRKGANLSGVYPHSAVPLFRHIHSFPRTALQL